MPKEVGTESGEKSTEPGLGKPEQLHVIGAHALLPDTREEFCALECWPGLLLLVHSDSPTPRSAGFLFFLVVCNLLQLYMRIF